MVTPIKIDGSQHKPMEPGDTIDPQFLPIGGAAATLTNIPDLALTPNWGTVLNQPNKFVLIKGNTLVLQYSSGNFQTAGSGLVGFDIPPTIQDGQGNTYSLADVNLSGITYQNGVAQWSFAFGINQSPTAGLQTQFASAQVTVNGSITYIR